MRSILDKVNERIRALVDFFTKPPSYDNRSALQSASVVVRLRMSNYEQAAAINDEQSVDWIGDLQDDLVENGAFLNYFDVESRMLIFEIYDKSVNKDDILNIIRSYNIDYEELVSDAKTNDTGLGHA